MVPGYHARAKQFTRDRAEAVASVGGCLVHALVHRFFHSLLTLKSRLHDYLRVVMLLLIVLHNPSLLIVDLRLDRILLLLPIHFID